MNDCPRFSSWLAYAAALWALIFATFHVIWACGWYVGLDQDQARIAFAKPLFFAYDIVVVGMCALAVAIALAPVQPWGRRLPPRLLLICAWIGTVLLVLRAGASVVQAIDLLIIGRFAIRSLGIWEPWFYLGAVLFGLNTWHNSRRLYQSGTVQRV